MWTSPFWFYKFQDSKTFSLNQAVHCYLNFYFWLRRSHREELTKCEPFRSCKICFLSIFMIWPILWTSQRQNRTIFFCDCNVLFFNFMKILKTPAGRDGYQLFYAQKKNLWVKRSILACEKNLPHSSTVWCSVAFGFSGQRYFSFLF